MPIIDEQEARALVTPHLAKFEDIFRRAWASWLINPVSARMQNKTVRANIIFNDALTEAKVAFDGGGEVRYFEQGKWHGILVADRLFIRLKKGTPALYSRNVKTRAVELFHDQDRDLFQGIARCELLYVLSADETEIENIVLVHRHKKSIVWSIDVRGDEDSQLVIPFAPMPSGDGGSGSVADRVVKPKRNEERENERQREASAGGGIST